MRIDLAGQMLEVPEHPVYQPRGARADAGSRLLAEAAGAVAAAGAGAVLAVNMAADPALALWRAGGASLRVQDERASAIAYAERVLAGPGPAVEMRLAVAPDLAFPGDADAALINLRYLWGRQPLRETLAAALAGLRTGGRLLLAGANGRGVRSAADDLQAAAGAAPEVLAYGKGHRLLAVVRPDGWQARSPAPGKGGEPVAAEAGGVRLSLRRTPGLFAEGLPDAGTQLLMAALPQPAPGQAVLDLGCGGGAVGIAAALRQPLAHVWAADDSLRAVRTARANAEASAVSGNFRAVHGDGLGALPPDLRFDLVASNPPYHFGAVATTALAEQWLRALPRRMRRGGRLYVVYNHFLPYLRVLAEAFGADNATLVAEGSGYRVAGAVRGGLAP